jgi:hypothetical protein
MSLSAGQIDAMVAAIGTFPWAQVQSLITNHDPADMAQLAADISSVIAEEVPDAELAAIGFEVIAWALRNPAVNGRTNEDPLGRGGRRS